jgi:mannose-6-phosphate isomerase-like protein (cupin superfamily)
MQGTAELVLDEQRLVLNAGDGVYFDAKLKHRLLSRDGEEVKVMAVVMR